MVRYWLIHRADYQKLLYGAAKEAGAEVVLGASIDYANEKLPAAVLVDGRKFHADLVIGADGTVHAPCLELPPMTGLRADSRTRHPLQDPKSGHSGERN